ncbi:MAG: calcium/sodium antiporter [Candidatus Thermoplasmatota archaeon]|nr:calcium/sodium antiporter [Candidatus Thermoplasmatota archaeon]
MLELILPVLGTIIGLGMLVGGANFLIEGAAGLARKIGISGHLIGVTLVATATSLPELATSVTASITGYNGIAVGNVVGSNAFNVGVVLAVGVIILPIRSDKMVIRDGWAVILATALFAVAAIGGIQRWEAAMILLAYIGYTIYLFRTSKLSAEFIEKTRPLPLLLIMTLIGSILLFTGSPILVNSAVRLSELLNVEDTFIGLSIIAFGTSLPELLTAVIAAIKGHEGIAIGNVLGSNLFNILMIIGVSGIIDPLEISQTMAGGIIPAMMLVTLIGVILSRKRMGRKEGFLLLLSYAAFMAIAIPW